MKNQFMILIVSLFMQVSLSHASVKTINDKAIQSIHATIECILSENNSIYYPIESENKERIIKEYIYLTGSSIDTLSIKIENKLQGILINASGRESVFRLEWDSDKVFSVTTNKGDKYFMLYDSNGKLVQIAKEKPFVLKTPKGRVVNKYKEFWVVDIVNDKINRIDRRLKPLDIKSGSYYKSKKNVVYSSGMVKISLTSYKTGKQRKPKNITNSMTTEVNLNKPITIKTRQISGNLDEVRIVEMNSKNNKVQVAKTQDEKVSITEFIYNSKDNRLSEKNTLVTMKGKFFEQIKISYEYNSSSADATKAFMKKFNESGECIFENDGDFNKYRKKIDGVWSSWKDYKY